MYDVLKHLPYGPKPRQVLVRGVATTLTSQLGIEKLLANGSYQAAFPLHSGPHTEYGPLGDANARHKLRENWSRFGKWYKEQPLDLVRGYFGEKIGVSHLCD